MKKNLLLGIGLCAVAALPAKALDIQFTSIANTFIQFNGVSGTFSFSPSVNQFKVTGVFDSAGDSLGDIGTLGGAYTIGAITDHWNLAHTSDTETAAVNFTGTLTIHDGHGHDLTAHVLQWLNITQVGTDLHLNAMGNANLSNFSYLGTQVDLANLANRSVDQTIDLEASLLGKYPNTNLHPDLHKLATGGKLYKTPFHGEIVSTVVPDGGVTVALMGLALAGVGILKRRIG